MEQGTIIKILLSEENLKLIEQLVTVHRNTKHYLLLAEELATDGVSFLQPLKEHRDAYEHMMRIFSLTIKTEDTIENIDFKAYIEDNLKKTCGHEYRAFFDTADWLTYTCRKYIRENLAYSKKARMYKSTYNDYDYIRTFINQVPFEIAKYRENKDISNVALLEEVTTYTKTLDTLIDIYKKVQAL